MKIIETFLEILAGLRIMSLPVLASFVAAKFIHYYYPSTLGSIAAISVLVVGISVGAFIAYKIHKKEGTVTYMGKLLRMPELEKKE